MILQEQIRIEEDRMRELMSQNATLNLMLAEVEGLKQSMRELNEAMEREIHGKK